MSKFGSGRTPDGTRLIRAFGLSRVEVAQLAAMELPNPDLPFRRVSIDPVMGITELRAVAAGKSPDWLELEFPDLQAPGGPAASRESKVTPGAQPADVKDGLRMLQDASTPAMEGSRRIANAFAQRLVQRMVGDR